MGNNRVSLDFDFRGVESALDQIGKDAGNHVRASAQAGAEVLYREAVLMCPESEDSHYFYGKNSKKSGVKYLFTPGNLKRSLYQVYSEDNSKEGKRATYHVAWNHRKAPYGFMVEFGTSRAPAHPFLRPAYHNAKQLALDVSYDVFTSRMAADIAKLS